MRRAAFIYEDALSRHVLREDHVMRPTRLRYTFELLDSYGAFKEPNSRLVAPRLATEEEVLWFHTGDYLEAVKGISRGESGFDPAAYNFSQYGDNPPYEGMYEAALLSTGASLVAAELLAKGEADVAFNASGGLHHAMPGYASGFCIFNDPVIAIHYLLRQGIKVAYVDIDVHHGDGVQHAFYNTNAVLTISLHESGRFIFPGTGEVEEMGEGTGKGYAVNLPLAPYTEDDCYLWALREVVLPLVQRFRPDVIVTQLGIDTHYLDPLGHLQLTTDGYTQAIRELGVLAPKWLALGGGGYDVGTVARAWCLAYGVMMEKEFPDDIPASYQERYGLKKLRDQEKPVVSTQERTNARQWAEDSVQKIKRLVFPVHGIG